MSGRENYKRFQTKKNSVEIGPSLLKIISHHWEHHHYAALFRVYLCAYTHVYTRGEEEEKPPGPGGFSLAPLQNVGSSLYFCLGEKEANGPCWGGGGGCLSREPQMLRKPKHWHSFCIGSAALPGRPCPPGPFPLPANPRRLSKVRPLPRTPPPVWQPAAVYCITKQLHKRILRKDQIINSE